MERQNHLHTAGLHGARIHAHCHCVAAAAVSSASYLTTLFPTLRQAIFTNSKLRCAAILPPRFLKRGLSAASRLL